MQYDKSNYFNKPILRKIFSFKKNKNIYYLVIIYLIMNNMNVLTLWLGAFGFAINKHIWENNPDKKFYAYEINNEVFNSLKETRLHPNFFHGYKLPSNIEVLNNIDNLIPDIDVLILAIPAQFIWITIDWIKNKLKKWVTILNLAKWIDISSNSTIWDMIEGILLWTDYNYAVLSWWMIAQELVEWNLLGADLWITNFGIWEAIKDLFESENLKIKLQKDIKNIELYWSFKNIMAILVGYYEWKWLKMSSIWFYFIDFYDEIKELMVVYWWNKNLDFSYYSFWWDLIATCFWNSRNKYFWNLLWSWKDITEVLNILKNEKKHAEGYETLKAVYASIKEEEWFKNIKFLYSLMQ